MIKYTLLSVCILCYACKSEKPTNTSFKDLEVSALAKELKLYTDAVILDVRTPEEVAEGNVKGSLNLDYRAANFETELKKLSKDKAYFVYCKSGGRSSKAMKKMEDLGFSRVYNILGGYTAISNPGK